MIQSDITAPILSYDDINKRAEDLLREYKRNKILPAIRCSYLRGLL